MIYQPSDEIIRVKSITDLLKALQGKLNYEQKLEVSILVLKMIEENVKKHILTPIF